MAEILNRAIKVFPTLPIPKDTEQRREYMEDVPGNIQKLGTNWTMSFINILIISRISN